MKLTIGKDDVNLSTSTLAALFGKNPISISDWVRQGLLMADLQEGTGRGKIKRYSYRQGLFAELVCHLKDHLLLHPSLVKIILTQAEMQGVFKDAKQGLDYYSTLLLISTSRTAGDRPVQDFIPEFVQGDLKEAFEKATFYRESGLIIEDVLIVRLARIKASFDNRLISFNKEPEGDE